MIAESVLSYYIQKFSNLRTDRTGGWTAATQGQAPHKPFLILHHAERSGFEQRFKLLWTEDGDENV